MKICLLYRKLGLAESDLRNHKRRENLINTLSQYSSTHRPESISATKFKDAIIHRTVRTPKRPHIGSKLAPDEETSVEEEERSV
jgi:hypothetical protein